MANIDKELKQIKNAIYGIDVRGSIHDGIDKINKEAEVATIKSEQAIDVTNNIIDESFDNSIIVSNFEQKLNSKIESLQPEWTEFQTQTKENFSKTSGLIDDVVVNVKKFGAMGNGINDDTNAIADAVNHLREEGRGTLYFPKGEYMVDFVTKIDFDCTVKGDGVGRSIIRVFDESTLFHNPSRTDVRTDYDLDSLYRDYHAVFFFYDCNFTVEGLEIDGNAYNQTEIYNGIEHNYTNPEMRTGVDYYKYYHGIQVVHLDNRSPRIEIRNCKIYHAGWNDVVIGNRNDNEFITDSLVIIEGNEFGTCPHDQLSIHRVSNVFVKNNYFVNPSSHSTHLYLGVTNAKITNNYYELNDKMTHMKPDLLSEKHKSFVIMGHSKYANNIIDNVLISENTMMNYDDNLINHIFSISTRMSVKDLRITNNWIENSQTSINIRTAIYGKFIITGNTLLSRHYPIAIRPTLPDGSFDPVPEELRPAKSETHIFDNVFESKDGSDEVSIQYNGGNLSSNPDIESYVTFFNSDQLRKYVIPQMLGFEAVDRKVDNTEKINSAIESSYQRRFRDKVEPIPTFTIQPKQSRKFDIVSGAFNVKDSFITATPQISLPLGIQFSVSQNYQKSTATIMYTNTNQQESITISQHNLAFRAILGGR